ncbi:aspartic proteinase CDR1-like [Malania oleifera]|uniref:aspartic proteinase CDR1-like n=1 Tax=Malania oleifera TaxID=397392 RepID=UPI0025AE2F56|nr:aspartic proteinase CDR1-like [Malania oleifera]
MAITLARKSLFCIAFALSMVLSPFSLTKARTFSASLIHRDSPESPFYDPSQSHFDSLGKALRRSVARAHFLNPASVAPLGGTITTQLTNNVGDYLMHILLGTSSTDIFAVADTSSDLVWTQCVPCVECYPQNNPLFDPRKSTTYQPIKCDSTDCEFTVGGTCDGPGDFLCHYSVFATVGLDNSYTHGVLAKESLSLGPTTLTNITVGCGYNNRLLYDDDNAQGMVGLGRGPVSLVSQLHDQIDGKFAYCLGLNNSGTGNGNNVSKLIFGGEASGTGVVSTALVPGDWNSSYYVKLETIGVGKQTIEFHNLALLDSAVLLTFLPQDLHTTVEAAVVNGSSNLTRSDDPYGLFNLCFNVKSESDLAGVPEFTMHFAGADVKLSRKNMFLKVTDSVSCLALVSTDGSEIIYGNLAQANFLVGYDTRKGTVSFKATDCAQI